MSTDKKIRRMIRVGLPTEAPKFRWIGLRRGSGSKVWKKIKPFPPRKCKTCSKKLGCDLETFCSEVCFENASKQKREETL